MVAAWSSGHVDSPVDGQYDALYQAGNPLSGLFSFAGPPLWIRPREKKALKTTNSERKIPLVGSSLYALRILNNGFTHYKNADTVSSTINKYLRENELKPSPSHSLYSLRHTFKDRLRDTGAPEEIIDELMGHKKTGPKYGRGHLLERKYEWLSKIAFDMSAFQ